MRQYRAQERSARHRLRCAAGAARTPARRRRRRGVAAASSPADLVARSTIVMLSLPSGKEVASLCDGAGGDGAGCDGASGLVALSRPGQMVVDFGTSPVALARDLAQRFAGKGVAFADAPVARTRQAAQQGTLSIMVGADAASFARIAPVLRCCASDISHCGEVGAGQFVKIMNNMILFQTGVALAEALALARRNDIDAARLFDTLSKGSADSFALRNHGMKAMLPGIFPEQAFSAAYALKDIGYALELAGAAGLELPGATLARDLLCRTIASGQGEAYWPALATVVAGGDAE
ncbi:MAG TPA: NAD(P)-dependent oxidoreductase [Stellaceae bacterium]|nr:NAD(P)-dependent oxidoreductase [Stellaceae bacterium]